MKISSLKNKNIAILGFGKEGNSTLNFLIKAGINTKNITILDKKSPDSFESGLNIISGEKYLNSLDKFDIIFKSPGISPYNPKIKKYKNKLSSGAEIFFENYKARVIGITGTKGKSTISTLTYEVLKAYGYKVKLVGNIGKPVLDEIDILGGEEYDYIVYELSSYMLEGFKPNLFIGVLNNIFPDHLDWHNNSINTYIKAKENILKNALNRIDNRTIENKTKFKTKLIGEHNHRNITVVQEICKTIGIKDLNRFENIIENFEGLPHRLENIGTFSGITFIDDAISTTPESTIEAIKTLGQKIGTIFLGGTNRGYKFNELVNYIKKYNIKNIVLFPDSGDEIKKLLEIEINMLESNINILKTSSMKEAVEFAYKNTGTGKICLLSTASPSYSIWKNFEEKGNLFRKYVKNYII